MCLHALRVKPHRKWIRTCPAYSFNVNYTNPPPPQPRPHPQSGRVSSPRAQAAVQQGEAITDTFVGLNLITGSWEALALS